MIADTVLPSFAVTVERDALRQFAAAIGEGDATYSDLDAALAAGHPDLPVPLTYLFSLELQRPDPYLPLRMIGVDLSEILHGEQRFVYHAMAFAGDELTFAPQIVADYTKRDGALRFLVRRTAVSRAGELVAELENVTVIPRLP